MDEKDGLDREAYRPKPLSDNQAAGLLADACGAKNASEFQALSKEEQRTTYPKLRAQGISIRQIARITGTSKGVVVRWGEQKKDR